MTNAELIQAIRNEIERRYNYEKEMYCDTKPDGRPNDGWAESLAIMGVLEEFLSFLSTLESEKPMNVDGLEDELKDYLRRYYNCDYPKQIEENTCSPTMPHIVEAARHFAQWGAEHFRDTTKMIGDSSEIPADLEEASSKFATHTAPNGVSVEFLEEKLSFQEGAKWAREQMMKDGLDAVKSGQTDKIEKTIAGVFVKYGMDRQKELIMKNAKDGWIDEECVIILNDGTLVDLQPDYEKKPAFEFEYAQDVRVIVLPKED